MLRRRSQQTWPRSPVSVTQVTASGRYLPASILYSTDFSPFSEAALSLAIRAARTCDARICALHVLMPTRIFKTRESVPFRVKNRKIG